VCDSAVCEKTHRVARWPLYRSTVTVPLSRSSRVSQCVLPRLASGVGACPATVLGRACPAGEAPADGRASRLCRGTASRPGARAGHGPNSARKKLCQRCQDQYDGVYQGWHAMSSAESMTYGGDHLSYGTSHPLLTQKGQSRVMCSPL
jgi:hypothetical protein